MPPAPGDRAARREDVSETVFQVLADKGFGGLTLRAVAAAMGVSTGMLMHYFPTKRALITHALELLEKRTAERPRRARPAAGLATVRAMLLDILPLTPGDTARNRIWVGSWDLSLADDDLAAEQAGRYTRLRSTLVPHLEAARELGELPGDTDPEQLAATVVAFTHGLVVQALFDPARFPEATQTAMLDDFLASTARPGRLHGGSGSHPPGLRDVRTTEHGQN
ncbi:TetR/AcrR family transcriptional regulator [Streptomyces zaomyceticus]|uniref:TetR/AcrR family transcriptional regulator n=1 Tax=Streptomyces zaomyceticus TaxID=68286 RepID=UPI00167529BF|nr:TetR/AcrR family transcriptional regulator [Streptomyces zaomyceticus]GHG07362.1 TetR family transcriptional regulator [Streptomyces zaomyceticus]